MEYIMKKTLSIKDIKIDIKSDCIWTIPEQKKIREYKKLYLQYFKPLEVE